MLSLLNPNASNIFSATRSSNSCHDKLRNSCNRFCRTFFVVSIYLTGKTRTLPFGKPNHASARTYKPWRFTLFSLSPDLTANPCTHTRFWILCPTNQPTLLNGLLGNVCIMHRLPVAELFQHLGCGISERQWPMPLISDNCCNMSALTVLRNKSPSAPLKRKTGHFVSVLLSLLTSLTHRGKHRPFRSLSVCNKPTHFFAFPNSCHPTRQEKYPAA